MAFVYQLCTNTALYGCVQGMASEHDVKTLPAFQLWRNQSVVEVHAACSPLSSCMLTPDSRISYNNACALIQKCWWVADAAWHGAGQYSAEVY